jgi:hypothetical protein
VGYLAWTWTPADFWWYLPLLAGTATISALYSPVGWLSWENIARLWQELMTRR